MQIRTDRKKFLEQYSKEILIDLYNKFGSVSSLSKELKCAHSFLLKIFKFYEIEYKLNNVHSVNDAFFQKINAKSAYWAGFIAADGCIQISNGRSGILSIKLAKKDENHLLKFKQDINATQEIKYLIEKNSKRNSKWKDSDSAYIQICNNKIVNDLSKFNIKKNKTKIYEIPEIILNSIYLVDFIRGYFDGDGCVGLNNIKNKTPSLYFDVRGTQLFCEQFSDIIKNNCLLDHKNTIRFDSGTARLRFVGNINCLKIFNWLYADNNIEDMRFLKRKYDIFNGNL